MVDVQGVVHRPHRAQFLKSAIKDVQTVESSSE
jgi:hypothetical protein